MRPTLTDFQASLNEPFQIHYGAGEALTVTLAEVRAWGPSAPENDPDYFQPFTITFQSAITEYLTQATYRISSARMGEHDIFIVPLGPNAQGMRYEAIFS